MRLEHRYFLGPIGGTEQQWNEVGRPKFRAVSESCVNQLYCGKCRARPGRMIVRIPWGMYFDDGAKRAGIRTDNGKTPWEDGYNGKRPTPR
ncbi:hypothetical protein Sgleb_16040 [Streptomyces glebosus]|uniref:Uncharacterized protein n=1 Tax=Streptomyces glebosus TaxID=249580 RepID=A0A640SQG2_9ACTN|nr:hypothetical protein [Streptomyces glebosus]GFE13557.1 hypothetical protein Sgleb_16040 [Streptomyces glebosus]GHG68757.1 hypothetical protein GCM10010513_39440 [Streptomyces glebosus]